MPKRKRATTKERKDIHHMENDWRFLEVRKLKRTKFRSQPFALHVYLFESHISSHFFPHPPPPSKNEDSFIIQKRKRKRKKRSMDDSLTNSLTHSLTLSQKKPFQSISSLIGYIIIKTNNSHIVHVRKQALV